MTALQVSQFTDDELDQFPALTTLAFKTGLGALLTGPNTPENHAALTKKCLETAKDPNTHYLKVTDPATGQIIAGAKWIFYPNGNTEAELEEMFQMPEPGKYAKSWDPIFHHLNDSRRDVMGMRPYYFLSILVTHPEHHRRGAGGMLVKWGTELADEKGIETYLEASMEGKPLYERLGFKVVKEVDFEMKDFGRPELGMDVNCIMLRPAKEKKQQ